MRYNNVNLLIKIVVVLVIFVACLVLVYIFKPSLISILKNSNSSNNNYEVSKSSVNQPAKIHTITVESVIPQISANITNSGQIMRLLDELNIWEGEKKIYETKSAIYNPIESVHIVLTEQKQEFNKAVEEVGGEQILIQSAGLKFNPSRKELILYLHINAKYIPISSSADLSEVYSYMALKRLYGIKEDVSSGQDTQYAQKNKLTFIQIEKNAN